MRLVLTLLFLAGCAPAGDVEARRDALPGAPDLSASVIIGSLGDHLGSALAGCPDGGFATGAPGNRRAYYRAHAAVAGPETFTVATSGDVGSTVACGIDEDGATFVIVGGFAGAWHFPHGTTLTQGESIESVAAHPTEVRPVLLAGAGGQSRTIVLDPTSGVTSSLPYGRSATWSARELILGDREAPSAKRYLFDDGGVLLHTLMLPSGSTAADFGRTVALGDVHPARGIEAIVGAPAASRVHVFSASGALLLTLAPVSTTTSTSFGASLLVEPGDAGGGLQALWVGQPDDDRVFRFVGDAGQTFRATVHAGSRFGAALAHDSPGLLVVGAPDAFLGVGGVFRGPFSDFIEPPVVDGIAQECQVGARCARDACTEGVCVGGVVCAAPFSSRLCGAGEICTMPNGCTALDGGQGERDAGAPDSGLPDAGGPDGGRDAGSTDAGSTTDAGSVTDAGAGTPPEVVRFEACGCHGGWSGPLLSVLLLLLARRR
ncbi:MAG: hypothetical protein ACOZQL_31265 [Myxococcota bacterium]